MSYYRSVDSVLTPSDPCPLCASRKQDILGIRGNREHTGADPNATPHLWTNVARCKNCGFIFANPMIPESARLEAEHYGAPERYRASFPEEHSPMLRSRLSLIAEHASSGRLLDVGAGIGEFVIEAQKFGFLAEGIEPSTPFCEYARKTHDLELHVGALGQATGPRKCAYDVITLNHVLEHVDEPKVLLETIREYLKPDGILFVEVPNAGCHMATLVDGYFRLRGRRWSCRLSPVHPPFHRYGYTQRALAFVLDATDYDVVTMQTVSGRERGMDSKAPKFDAALREIAFSVLAKLGNRELLCAIARPRRRSSSSLRSA